MKGTIKRWFRNKGYGFISRDDGQGDVFLHISNLRSSRTPRIGSVVYFDIEDDDGKPRATNIRFAGQQKRKKKLKIATSIFFALVAVILILHFTKIAVMPITALFYAVASLLAFMMYHSDKRAAQMARKRISEGTLHMVELFGGWPGSWLAGQLFRHKTAKTSYRVIFWSIVVIHAVLWWWLIKNGCTTTCDSEQFISTLLQLIGQQSSQ